MDELKKMLLSVEEKHKRFTQQQSIFIKALERTREQAYNQIHPVSTVTEVQWYMTHHCSNATDRRIISLFLDIMADLMAVFQRIESLASAQDYSSEVLDKCRDVLRPDHDFSQLKAHYPHIVMNRLSCNEAQNYGGVVSVIPLTLNLLNTAISELEQSNTETDSQTEITPPPEQPTAADNAAEDASVYMTADPHASTRSSKPARKGAWKPAWKPTARRM